MKTMRKCQVLLLVLVMLFALCACSQGEKNPTTEPAATTQPVQTTAPTTEPPTTAPDDGKVTYQVKVVDQSGKPLAGVAVQLCKDYCVFATTNGDGVAEFRLAEDAYHASVMVLPEGYTHAGEQVEFDFEKGSTEMTITLKAAG